MNTLRLRELNNLLKVKGSKWQIRDSNPSGSDSKVCAFTNKVGVLNLESKASPALSGSALPGFQ